MNRGIFILKCVLLGALAILMLGLVTMILWNWLIPVLFHGPVITYGQALGILVLSKILFSGIGGGKRCGNHQGEIPYWKSRFSERFSAMSEAERESFKQKMKAKWCRFDESSSESSSSSQAKE